MTAIGGSAASVVEAIRDEVEMELEKRRKDLDESLAAAERETAHADFSAADRAARLTQARERARVLLAHEDWLDSREALESRERWILRAAAEGGRLLRERETGPGGPELLRKLAAEAIARLPGDAFEVIVSESAAARLEGAWRRQLAEQSGRREVRPAPRPLTGTGGGCIVQTADGRVSFDNSFEARARRLETAWRSALAGLYG